MANNFVVKDANSNTVTFQSTDVGGGTQLQNTKLNDGTNDIKSASAANLAAQTGINAAMVAGPGQWTQTHAPAVNTQATKSQAAGAAGVRHVCTWIAICLSNDSTGSVQTVLTFNLRDGATGAGTILASFTLALPATAGESRILTLSGLNIPGSSATAMTLESAGTPAAHTAASVAFGGYDVS